MPEGAEGERRAFLRRSIAQAAEAALRSVGRSAPPADREQRASSVLASIDHLVLLSFAGRARTEVFGALDGEPGEAFVGDTDAVMTAPLAEAPPGSGTRFAPEMLPVHTLLAGSFGRAANWSADGRDPLRLLLRSARAFRTEWALVVDEKQGVSTTLLDDPEWAAEGSIAAAGGTLVPLAQLGAAAARGVLPPVILVEPRTLLDPADFASAAELGEPRATDARLAESLLHEVYDAVRRGEHAGRRMLLIVAARSSSGGLGPVPALVVASGVRPGAVIEAPLGPETPSLLHRARSGRDREALSEDGVLTLVEAIAGPLRPLSRWPRTSPSFVPPSSGELVGPRLSAALARLGLAPGRVDETAAAALPRLRAAAPGASLHSEQREHEGRRR